MRLKSDLLKDSSSSFVAAISAASFSAPSLVTPSAPRVAALKPLQINRIVWDNYLAGLNEKKLQIKD
jgi:hypothetical protein